MRHFVVFTFCFVLVYGEFTFPDVTKCELKDNKCIGKLYQQFGTIVGKHGVPELGIPPVDPMDLNDLSVSILGTLNITMVKGVATGIKDCVIKNFSMDLSKGTGSHEVICSINIKGKYKMVADSPLIKTVLGSGQVTGDGNVEVNINKVLLTFKWDIEAKKKSDDKIYFISNFKKTVYDFKVLGGVKFNADGIYLDNRDVSKEVIPLMNESWELIMSTFGGPFMDKAVKIYQHFLGKILEAFPANNYISDDLSPYVKT